jgi:mono/diheme cytochrome c family protein
MMFTRALRYAALIGVLFASAHKLHAAQQEHAANSPAARANLPSGEELFNKHCAVCHGQDLKGVGPAPAPYKVPPDLTRLSRRHRGKFPESYVQDILRNGALLPEHGMAQMSAWGTDFREMHGFDASEVEIRISNLTNYIKSRQIK